MEFKEQALEGISLTIWKEVVYDGHHLVLHTDTRPVAVVVPYDDYHEMQRLIEDINQLDIYTK